MEKTTEKFSAGVYGGEPDGKKEIAILYDDSCDVFIGGVWGTGKEASIRPDTNRNKRVKRRRSVDHDAK